MSESKPVQTINYGAVRAAIWQNDTAKGRFYDISFERLYRNDKTWEISRDFRARDLLLLAKVAMDAHTWAYTQMQKDREKFQESESASDEEIDP